MLIFTIEPSLLKINVSSDSVKSNVSSLFILFDRLLLITSVHKAKSNRYQAPIQFDTCLGCITLSDLNQDKISDIPSLPFANFRCVIDPSKRKVTSNVFLKYRHRKHTCSFHCCWFNDQSKDISFFETLIIGLGSWISIWSILYQNGLSVSSHIPFV